MTKSTSRFFARSKFVAPTGGAILSEHPLANRIEEALDRAPLVLASAPAGFGKTTALAAWSAATRRRIPVWIRLDADDDDSHTLAQAIVAAVESATSTVMRRTEDLLATPSDGDITQLAAALANDLDDLQGVAVVLDDLQHLRAEDSLFLLRTLLDMLGASNRVLMASRSEPPIGLPARRVRRQVVDFGVEDLRLHQSDVEVVLRSCGLDDSDLAARITSRSGGWAAAAVLMAARAATSGRSAVGTETPLTTSDRDVDEFIRAEILGGLDTELQRFVLETSLLDELTTRACAVVTSRDDSEQMLDRVGRHGLLVDRGDASSYHDRVADVLRRELAIRTPRAELEDLYRRAAVVSAPGRAIQLLLEIGELGNAAALVVAAGRIALDNPGVKLPRTWLAPFARSTIMESGLAEPTETAAWLATFVGLSALEHGDSESAIPSLDAALSMMRALGDEAGLWRAGYGRAEAHLARGEVEPAAQLMKELMGLRAPPEERARLLVLRLWLTYFDADWPTIEATLDEAFAITLAPCGASGRSAVARGLGSEFLFTPRGPQWLADRCVELGTRIDDDRMATASLELMRAAAHLLTGRFAEVDALVANIDGEALEGGGLNWLGLFADRLELALALVGGNHSAVDDLVNRARRHLDRSDRHRQERAMYAYALARSGSIVGDQQRVRSAHLLIGEVSDQDRPDTVITEAVVRSMVLRNEDDLEAAEAALNGVRAIQHQLRFCLVTGVVDLELAATLLAANRSADAIAAARPAVELLDDLGAYGVVALDGPDTHRAVLEACATLPDLRQAAARVAGTPARIVDPASRAALGGGEHLTGREVDVLRLVMEGLSNREIGAELFISERTVKSHMTSLLRKLGVPSRAAAMARARDLGLG